MIKYLIKHHYKKNSRSAKIGEGIGVKIVYWIIVAIMFLYLLTAGLLIDVIMEKLFPGEDIVRIFNGFILYYLGIDLFMRFMLQGTPVVDIGPYLHLPIPKNNLIHYTLLKSIGSLFNYLPYIIFIPFAIKAIIPQHGIEYGLAWLVLLTGFIQMNNYLAMYLKRNMVGNSKLVLMVGLAIVAVMTADYLNWLNLSSASSLVVGEMASMIYPVIITLVFAALLYALNFSFLKKNMYLEAVVDKKQNDFKATNYGFLRKFGKIGELIQLELKLIFRNKRPKMAFWMSVFMVLYGLVFYTQEKFLDSPAWLSFVGIFITGMFLFNYGQFLIAWNSQFFDKVLTLPINLRTYVESKFWFLVAMTGISFLLSIPYIYFGWTIVYANLMACLFNLGINTFVILFFSTEKTKRIHLAKTTVFNYEGITAVQFIMMLPAMLLPVFIVMPFSIYNIPLVGFGVLGFIGLIGIFTSPMWLKFMIRRLEKSKYRVAAGLRNE